VLCDRASSPDWLYLVGLFELAAASVLYSSWNEVKLAGSEAVRYTGPALVGLTWGATLGGAWLALPKCSPQWVDEPPREGDVRVRWPLALSIALLSGATAPIVNGIAVGNLPQDWSTVEREMHVVTAAVFGLGGALLPYLLPPRTYASARELERIRFAPISGRTSGELGGAYISYSTAF
jgi:hypothetical protein